MSVLIKYNGGAIIKNGPLTIESIERDMECNFEEVNVIVIGSIIFLLLYSQEKVENKILNKFLKNNITKNKVKITGNSIIVSYKESPKEIKELVEEFVDPYYKNMPSEYADIGSILAVKKVFEMPELDFIEEKVIDKNIIEVDTDNLNIKDEKDEQFFNDSYKWIFIDKNDCTNNLVLENRGEKYYVKDLDKFFNKMLEYFIEVEKYENCSNINKFCNLKNNE